MTQFETVNVEEKKSDVSAAEVELVQDAYKRSDIAADEEEYLEKVEGQVALLHDAEGTDSVTSNCFQLHNSDENDTVWRHLEYYCLEKHALGLELVQLAQHQLGLK